MISTYIIISESPLGRLVLFENDGALTALSPMDLPAYRKDVEEALNTSVAGSSALLQKARLQLTEYFDGKRTTFTIPLNPVGTDFQHFVWQTLQKISYGGTCTYGEMAAMMGNPKAARAVGSALHSNPLPIFIPCHRVLPSNGGIGGFAWGKEAKRLLLAIEGRQTV